MTLLCMQNGPVEDDLKNNLVPFLQSDMDLQEAYLLRAKYEDGSDHVVLALFSTKTNIALVEKINRVFESMFASNNALDITFMNSEMQKQANAIGVPFYKR